MGPFVSEDRETVGIRGESVLIQKFGIGVDQSDLTYGVGRFGWETIWRALINFFYRFLIN